MSGGASMSARPARRLDLLPQGDHANDNRPDRSIRTTKGCQILAPGPLAAFVGFKRIPRHCHRPSMGLAGPSTRRRSAPYRFQFRFSQFCGPAAPFSIRHAQAATVTRWPERTCEPVSGSGADRMFSALWAPKSVTLHRPSMPAPSDGPQRIGRKRHPIAGVDLLPALWLHLI